MAAIDASGLPDWRVVVVAVVVIVLLSVPVASVCRQEVNKITWAVETRTPDVYAAPVGWRQ
jgi:hypothetical protein